jgi:hypothetical protein
MNSSPGAGRRPASWRPASVWTLVLGIPVVAALCFLTLSGCSGCNQGPNTTNNNKADKDLLSQARQQFQSSNDAGKFRQANQLLNKHLEKQSDAVAKYQVGTRARPALERLVAEHAKLDAKKLDDRALYRKFLETVVGLDAGEIEEVEAETFRLLDAHYLDGCEVMREAARGMPLETLTPAEQAEYCFRWVARYVALDEGRDDMVPPQFVLERGLGSSRERAFLFAALLQQLNIDAVAIAVPFADGTVRPVLAGVLIPAKDTIDVLLFDFRLGLPLPGPEGKGIATLKQLQADPKLLQAFSAEGAAYDVTADQFKKLEIWLIAPLSGLSARMRYLEDEVLRGFQPLNVAVRLPELMEQCEKLQAGPVRVWNQPAKAGPPAQTPTRALRLFLPPDEGGVDKPADKNAERYRKFRAELSPELAFRQALDEMKLGPAELPGKDAQQQLEALCRQVWANYVLASQQFLVRGRLDDSANRVVRLQAVLRDLEGLQNNQEFQLRINAWRDRLRMALTDPATADKAWNEDPWIWRFVRNPEETDDRDLKKQTLSEVILAAVARPAEPESDRVLALRWQETAERLAVQIKAVQAGDGLDALHKRRKQALSNAQTYWSNYGQRNTTSLGAFPAKAGSVTVKGATAPPLDTLAYYARNAKRSAASQLLQAEALEFAGQTPQAQAVLAKLLGELETLKNGVDWLAIRTAVGDKGRKAFEEIHDDLTRTGGTADWTRHAVLLRLARLKGPPR